MPLFGSSIVSTAIRSAVVLALGGATYALCYYSPDQDIPSEAGLTLDLPSNVSQFLGKDMPVSESELALLPKDTQFAKKLYTNFTGDQVNCQIVLSGGEKRSIHRPEICLPAQGWNLRSGNVIEVPLKDGKKLDVMKLIISRPIEIQPGVRKELTSVFLYWFVGKNMTTPYHWLRLAHTNWDRVVHNINHRWAYVIVSAPVTDGFVPGGKNQEQTLNMLKEFIATIEPEVVKSEVQLADSSPAVR